MISRTGVRGGRPVGSWQVPEPSPKLHCCGSGARVIGRPGRIGDGPELARRFAAPTLGGYRDGSDLALLHDPAQAIDPLGGDGAACLGLRSATSPLAVHLSLGLILRSGPKAVPRARPDCASMIPLYWLQDGPPNSR
jgi:hypothetical protein